ncbi:MAG: hypothetical protein JKX85_11130 [Phycisphaeraceae bacterium]|nr:hypothetical protein [Phycisphaeraceae bacterium]
MIPPIIKRLCNEPTAATRFLVLLLAADLVFILIQIPYHMGMMSNPFFSIEADMGYAEIYQYIKEFWIILLLFGIAIQRPRAIYLAWMCLFIYVLCDDALSIHETVGRWIATQLDLQPMFGLRSRDFGELMVSAVAGGVLFSSIGIAYFFSDLHGKTMSRHLVGLFALLVLFGVGVDMIHQMVSFGKDFWGIVEDGGEMGVISLMVWYLFNLQPPPPEVSPD